MKKRLIILILLLVSVLSQINAFAAYNSAEQLTDKPTSHGLPLKHWQAPFYGAGRVRYFILGQFEKGVKK